MKHILRLFTGCCILAVFCLAIEAQTEIPEYSSTFNTGLGKQQRLNAVEDQLIVLTQSQQAAQEKIYKQMPSEEEINKMQQGLKNSKAQIEKLNQQIRQLQQKNTELEAKLKRVEGEELRALVDFVLPLKEEGWDEIKQEVEGLKLSIRSMEAVIESMHNDSP